MCVDCVLASPKSLKLPLVDEPLAEVVLPQAPPITHRRTAKKNEWTKSLKTCWEHASWSILVDGTRIYHGLSSHATIATKRVWKWHPLRFSMDNDVIDCSIGLSQGRKWYLVLTSSMRQKQRFVAFKITWKSWSHAKRVMQKWGVNPWCSRWETTYNWGSRQWRAWRGLG
jgi:hypothetical protein